MPPLSSIDLKEKWEETYAAVKDLQKEINSLNERILQLTIQIDSYAQNYDEIVLTEHSFDQKISIPRSQRHPKSKHLHI